MRPFSAARRAQSQMQMDAPIQHVVVLVNQAPPPTRIDHILIQLRSLSPCISVIPSVSVSCEMAVCSMGKREIFIRRRLRSEAKNVHTTMSSAAEKKNKFHSFIYSEFG